MRAFIHCLAAAAVLLAGCQDGAGPGDAGGDAWDGADGYDAPADSVDGPAEGMDPVADGPDGDEGDGPDPWLCPPPPDDLPEATITADGRFMRIGALSFPGLLDREVTVYLPEAYASSPDERFPVIYMHDGQNLFDPAQAAFGVEGQVDETLDALTAGGRLGPHIVVGIHNTAERIDDYTPDPDPSIGSGGKGDLYADFIVNLLKPVVDASFRTLCGRENTALAGSSLGGLVSLHIVMRYPDVFGAVGCLSPSFWWNEGSLVRDFEAFTGPLPLSLWIDAGTAEGEPAGSEPVPAYVADVRAVRDLAVEAGMVFGRDLGGLEDPGAPHNEAAWAARLDGIFLFLLSPDRPVDLAPTDLSVFAFHDVIYAGGTPSVTGLAVEARYAGGRRLTWPNALVALESLTPEVAALSADGTVSALSQGTGRIGASFEGLTATGSVEVVETGSVTITLNVQVPAWTPASDTVYAAGSIPELGAWDPAGAAMDRVDALNWTLELTLSEGTYFEYKFTRGSWDTVEKASDGSEIPNRSILADSDGAHYDHLVQAWADD